MGNPTSIRRGTDCVTTCSVVQKRRTADGTHAVQYGWTIACWEVGACAMGFVDVHVATLY
eukprot:1040064-Prymnesium_polylepis.1